MEKSETWCCELCGGLIIGECNNDNGYITHIGGCMSSSDDYLKIELKGDN